MEMTFFYGMIAVLSATVIGAIIAHIVFNCDLPGSHTKILGTRYYRISLKCPDDIDEYGFDDPSQLEKFKYIVEKIVDHISLNELVKLYWTRMYVQTLADSYYSNLSAVYVMYKEYKRKKVGIVDYERTRAGLEKENAKIIKKLRQFNQEVVNYINYIEDDDDDRIKSELRDSEYDLSGVGECLKDII